MFMGSSDVAQVRAGAMIGRMPEQILSASDAGQRLDRYLRKLLVAMPLSAIFKHLRSGRIRVDGKKAKPDLRLVAGMVLSLDLSERDLAAVSRAAPTTAAPPRSRSLVERPRSGRARAPAVVFRDEHLLVVDKPSGMASQPGSGHDGDDLVTWVRRELPHRVTATFAPGPAHRLDVGTSGLVAIGLTPAAARALAESFRDGTAHKQYVAVVHGVPVPPRGTIDAPLLTVPAARADQPKVRVDARGQVARTDYEVLSSRGDRSLVRLRLHTGRLHQIRAHLSHLGHPVVGDRRYGSSVRLPDAIRLRAVRLELPHPVTGESLVLEAPPAAEFAP